LWQRNSVEQSSHGFENGYSRFLFPCHFFGEGELPLLVALDDAAVVSADDLICAL